MSVGDAGPPPEEAGPHRKKKVMNYDLTGRMISYLKQNPGIHVTLVELASELQAPKPNISATISYAIGKGVPIERVGRSIFIYHGPPPAAAASPPSPPSPLPPPQAPRRLPSAAAARREPPSAPLRGVKIAVEAGEMFEAIGSTHEGDILVRSEWGIIFKLVKM